MLKHTLQIRQGKHCGFQLQVLALNSNKDLVCFISAGKNLPNFRTQVTQAL